MLIRLLFCRTLLANPKAWLLPGSLALGLALSPLAALAGKNSEDAACAAEVELQAEHLQRCLVNQKEAGECDARQAAFDAQFKRCSLQGLSLERLALARQIGMAKVPGDPAQSPYQIKLAKQREALRLLGENKRRFDRLFAPLLNYAPGLLEDGFNTDRCPLAFEGRRNRFVFTGYLVVKRTGDVPIPLTQAALTGDPSPQTHLFFARMNGGDCYRPGTTELVDIPVQPDDEAFVYNLHAQHLDNLPARSDPVIRKEVRQGTSKSAFRLSEPLVVEVEQYPSFLQGKVNIHRCDSILDCLEAKQKILGQYEEYQQALKDKEAAVACLNYLKANETGDIDIEKLYGKDCSRSAGEAGLKAADEAISRLSRQLFLLP